MTRSTPLKERSLLTILEHPLAALVSMITLATMLGGAVIGVINFFVLKSDFTRIEAWHNVGHIQLRVERLTDEVERLQKRAQVAEAMGQKFPVFDQADLETYRKKLGEAGVQLSDAVKEAKAASK
jgi:hypothetical protein